MSKEITTTMAASIVSTIVEAIGSFLIGVGGNIVEVFDKIVVAENGGLTNFAVWALVFGGIALAGGVISAILRKVG